MKRKTNPFIQSLNTAISTAKRKARDEYETAKRATHKRLEWRAKYASIFKNVDAHALSISLYSHGMTAYIFLNDLDSFNVYP